MTEYENTFEASAKFINKIKVTFFTLNPPSLLGSPLQLN